MRTASGSVKRLLVWRLVPTSMAEYSAFVREGQPALASPGPAGSRIVDQPIMMLTAPSNPTPEMVLGTSLVPPCDVPGPFSSHPAPRPRGANDQARRRAQ